MVRDLIGMGSLEDHPSFGGLQLPLHAINTSNESPMQPLKEDSTPTSARQTSATSTRDASQALATNSHCPTWKQQYAMHIWYVPEEPQSAAHHSVCHSSHSGATYKHLNILYKGNSLSFTSRTKFPFTSKQMTTSQSSIIMSSRLL